MKNEITDGKRKENACYRVYPYENLIYIDALHFNHVCVCIYVYMYINSLFEIFPVTYILHIAWSGRLQRPLITVQ